MGQIWTNKTAEDVGYFSRIQFRTSDEYMKVPCLNHVTCVKYKYTEIEKVKKLCPKKAVKRREERYPSRQYNDLRFDMSVQNSKYFSWSSAEPIFIGQKMYGYSASSSRWGGYGEIAESEIDVKHTVPDDIHLNVSDTLSFLLMGNVKLGAGYSSLYQSLDSHRQLKISAEGVFDARIGYLCMVGCRTLGLYDSLDCEIVLNFQFPGSNVTDGGFIKGSMKSTRKQSDPLYFEHLKMTATSFSSCEAQRSVWRIDLEIIMVLISNTLACIFVCFQLYHVKRCPNSLPYVSLVMLVILTLGYMIPLVQNFKALFLEKENRHNTMLSSSAWLGANEVITMVAFLLQFRLLQLAWTARRSVESNEECISDAEKKTLLVSLSIYIVGEVIAFLVNLKKKYGNSSHAFDYWEQQRTLWGDLRSCTGLILDGFLFPQVLLYIFQVPSQSALSHPFYLGTTLVHSLPHAYDLYRANHYVPVHVNGTYLYANPSADFYSAAWDIIIPFAGLLLAAIIFLQQIYGGRFILPRTFKELELYAMVPVVNT